MVGKFDEWAERWYKSALEKIEQNWLILRDSSGNVVGIKPKPKPKFKCPEGYTFDKEKCKGCFFYDLCNRLYGEKK